MKENNMKKKMIKPQVIYRKEIVDIINHIANGGNLRNQLDCYVYEQFNNLCDRVGSFVNSDCTPIENLTKYLAQDRYSIRVINCLRNDKIKYVEELVALEARDLYKIPNFGIKCLLLLKDAWIKAGHRISENTKIVLKNGNNKATDFTFEW